MKFKIGKEDAIHCAILRDENCVEKVNSIGLKFGDMCYIPRTINGNGFYQSAVVSEDGTLIKLCDTDGIIPTSITKHIEDPINFYKEMSHYLRDSGLTLFVELDHEAHADIIKTRVKGDYSKYRLKYGPYKGELLYKTEKSKWHLVKEKK